MKKILKILEIPKINIIILIFISIILAIIQVSYNIVLKPMIDNIVINKDFSKLIIFFILIFVSIIFNFIKKLYFLKIFIKSEKKLNYKITNAIVKVKLNYYENKKEGEITSILTKKIPEIKDFFYDNFEKFIFNPINFLFTIIGILIIDYKIAILLIPVVLISIVIDFKLGNRIISSSNTVFNLENEILSYEKEVIENIENIKMASNEQYILNKYNKKNEKYLFNIYKMLKDYQIAYIPSLLNEYLPTILLLFISIFKISKNEMSYGTFLATLNLVTGASLPFSHYLRILTKIKAKQPVINEILYLLNDKNFIEKSKEEIVNNKLKFIENNKIIELKNVNFSYNNKKILENINLTIQKNEKVAIIGKTGSGKSTLLKLILGLYEENCENITVFGVNPNNNQKQIWNNISYLDNNIYLFSDTIEFNITLLKRELTKDEKIKLNNIINFLKIEDLLQKKIEQFGSNLSGGQRLKISIARALFKESKLLIFDEPTSALDEESENIICELLKNIKITLLIVTHREKILNICDNVYEIKEKKLVKKEVI